MRVLAWALLGACAIFFIGGLLFRATVYARLPVAPGDAYGIADLIELGIAILLMVSAASAFALGLALVVLRKLALVRLGVVLLVVSAGAALTYIPLHGLVPSR